MATIDINYVGVLVAAIVGYAIGAFWYSPTLFGERWLKLMDFGWKKTAEMKKTVARGYVVTFIAMLLMSYVLAHFVDYAGAGTFALGMVAGFWIWLGFFVTTMIGSVFWEGKPFELYLINIGHYLVALLLMGGILAVWG